MRAMIIGVLLLALAGCGSVYISPDVPGDDPNVDVVPLSMATVKAANASRYQPKSLPAVFYKTAAGQGGNAAQTPAQTTAPAASLEPPHRPNTVPVRIPPSAPDAPYDIGVGDVILLATPTAGSTVEELSGLLAAQNRRQGYTVQDDGAIAIPDIGRITVAGMTLEAAEVEVFQRLVENQIDPSFSIEIAEFNSKHVSVGGAVAKPAVVPITLTALSLERALAAAGGISSRDLDFTTIRLYRDGALYQVPVDVYLQRPDVQKTRLAAGDSIFVDVTYELDRAQDYFREQITLAQFQQSARVQALAALNSEITLRRAALEEERANFQTRVQMDAVDRDYVYLTGEVGKPSRFALPFGQQASLADALFGQGGMPTQTADPRHIYVLRGQGETGSGETGRISAYNLNVQNAAHLVLATKLQLRPDDIIFVAEQPITRWHRVIQQITPSLVTSGAGIVAAN